MAKARTKASASPNYRRREREALARIFDALGCVTGRRLQALETAAEALEWRNRRLAALEAEIIRLGGWPWNVKFGGA